MRINKNIVIERSQNKPIVLDTFYKPSDEKLPIVIFCHGYKGFKDWGAWDLVATHMATNGFFFIKFNFSHNGCTVEKPLDFSDLDAFGNNNYSKELEDINDVINYCESNYKDQTDLSKISLIGHSRGGGIVTLFSAENKRIHKLISWAGVSDFAVRFPEGEAFEMWTQKKVFYVLNGRTKQNMPHYFQFWEDYIANPERFDIEKACKTLHIPHLIIHGTDDSSVPFWEAEDLHEWNPKSELYLITGANHVFGAQHPWHEKEMPFHLKQVITKTTAFLKD